MKAKINEISPATTLASKQLLLKYYPNFPLDEHSAEDIEDLVYNYLLDNNKKVIKIDFIFLESLGYDLNWQKKIYNNPKMPVDNRPLADVLQFKRPNT